MKLGIEAAGLAALVIYTVFSILQWAQIRWTNRLTREALNGNNNSLDQTLRKMDWQIHVTQEIANQTLAQAQHTNRLANDTHDLATAAGKQADAAKSLADFTAKQFTANQQLIESQGAAITISGHSAIAPLAFHENGEVSANIAVSLSNVGGLTASKVTVRSLPYYSQWGENIFREPQQRQHAFCSKPIPTYPGDVIDTSLTILPHTAQPYQINFGFRKPEQAEIIDWPPKGTADQLPKKKVIFLIVVGCIDYQSGLMSGSHQTGFIFWIQKGTGSNGDAPGPIPYGIDIPKEQIIVSPNFFGQGKSY